jgi:predicted PurR-regulated permease PerM
VISLVNTAFTVVFLSAMGFPYIPFLALATFIFGCIPIVGNLVSNTLICGTALTISPQAALGSLAFLVAIHQAEYFLNSRIMGSYIEAPMWQLLLGMLVGEGLLGVPGVVLAPAVMHYVREEMRAIPVTDASRQAWTLAQKGKTRES